MNNNMPSLLIVDDNERNLIATKRVLDDLDINIHTVLSGEEALKEIVKTDFFLILLDVQMPVMDGFETASIIHGNDNYKNIPIIFLTAIKKDDKYIRTGYEEGAVDYMMKPFNSHTLISKTKVFLELYLNKKELESAKSSALSKAEELDELNKNLEKLVDERTKVLNESLNTLKQTQKQMIESEKMAALGNLVAGVAHEINTPIGLSLTGITHLKDITKRLNKTYEKQEMSEEAFQEYLKTCIELDDSIYSNLVRASELIKSFKSISADQTSEKAYMFVLKEKINHVVYSLHNHLKKTKIKINVDCENSIQVYTYPGVIYQIFTNLITNSLIHGFEGKEEGEILIKAFNKDNFVHMIYKDSGKGIDEVNLSKVFDPFFTTNRKAGGTGLGLHIIYNIIKSKLNGNITVKSEKGKGVEFEITFSNLTN